MANPVMTDEPRADEIDDCQACREYRELSRRAFLGRSKVAAAGVLTTPAWLPHVALGGGRRAGGRLPDVLVYVFLRGGPDMLAQIVPYGDPFLYVAPYNSPNGSFPNGLRPTIGLAPPDNSDPDPAGLHCLDLGGAGNDAFGINKAYADREFGGVQDRNTLKQLYDAGEVAFITAAGSPDTNRSHFSAEAYIEYGTPNQPHDELTGWLARYLAVMPSLGSPLRGAALSTDKLIPKSLAFAEKTLAFQEIDAVVLPGNPATAAQREAILAARYEEQTADPLKSGVLNTFDVIALLSQVNVMPHPDAMYTTSTFGARLRNAAALVKGGVNVEVIYTDRTGWDDHSTVGPFVGGNLYNRIKDVSQNLAAFRIDLQDHWHRVTLVMQGEFGRQNNENGNAGTDHGNSGVMMVMGGNTIGGVYSRQTLGGPSGWPGLDPELLLMNDAIKTTTDYRNILREVLSKRMGADNAALNYIFPTDGEQPPFVADELGLVNIG